MNIFDRLILVLVAVLAARANDNAREAHRHLHEISCHVGAADLCKSNDGETK